MSHSWVLPLQGPRGRPGTHLCGSAVTTVTLHNTQPRSVATEAWVHLAQLWPGDHVAEGEAWPGSASSVLHQRVYARPVEHSRPAAVSGVRCQGLSPKRAPAWV